MRHVKPLIGEDYQLQAHQVGDTSVISCRSCGHLLRKITTEEIEDVTAEIRFSLKPKNIWFGPPAPLAVSCPGFTGTSLSLPGIDPPKKRYPKGRKPYVMHHKMTRGEQDVMVGEYEQRMLKPSELIEKWDISPGQLYYILKKHHIDTTYKPKQGEMIKYLTDTGLYTEIILTKKFNTADTVLKRMTDK
jgi:hypothetical protein